MQLLKTLRKERIIHKLGKISATYITDKEPVYRLYKELLQLR